MDGRSPASFAAADLDLVQGLQDTLRRDIAKGCDYGGLVRTVLRHLERFQKASVSAAALEKFPSWGSIVCIADASPANGHTAIEITGPFADDRFEADADSSQEVSELVRYASALDVACHKLEEIRVRALAVVEKHAELEKEQSHLRQPAATTVDDHIRLLRQYNKTKDVGQQLIGLIAEGRGVPLGSVYRDGDYGVRADD